MTQNNDFAKRVLLVDVDSRIPNLALMKLSTWHKSRGHVIGLEVEDPELVYISCIFRENVEKAKAIAATYPHAKVDIGGPGFDLKKELPTAIENLIADYNLFPSTYSQDYTSRGCSRKCGFCIVPEKEGDIRIAKHPREFHDDRFNTCMFMDNNLFAAPRDWQREVFY